MSRFNCEAAHLLCYNGRTTTAISQSVVVFLFTYYLYYNKDMKMTVEDLKKEFLALIGDMSDDTVDPLIIKGLNWAFNDLPLVPRLGKLFSQHYTRNLDAKNHYKWCINGDFRRLIDTPVLNFYTSTGEEPCRLPICYKRLSTFYNINGLVSLKRPGKPCQYTREEINDKTYIVLDRPSDVPLILDYIACGFPKPVTSLSDEIDLSAIAENLVLSIMRTIYYQEASDFAFSGAILDYCDNKLIPEAIQALEKQYSSDGPIILGEA